MFPDRTKSILNGGLAPWTEELPLKVSHFLEAISTCFRVDLNQPFEKLPAKVQSAIWNGTNLEKDLGAGILKIFQEIYYQDFADGETYGAFMVTKPCSACAGKRLRPESLAVKISDLSIADLTALPVDRSLKIMRTIQLNERELKIAGRILEEIVERLQFLDAVGLNYLSLDRSAATLSGGEGQRIRLATQIGSRFRGVLYVLDEPSIGLHNRDNQRLLLMLEQLRDSVIRCWWSSTTKRRYAGRIMSWISGREREKLAAS